MKHLLHISKVVSSVFVNAVAFIKFFFSFFASLIAWLRLLLAKRSWHSKLPAMKLVFLDVSYLNWPLLNPVMGWVHHSSQLFKTHPAQSNTIMKLSSSWRWNHMSCASKCDAAASGKCWVCASSPWKVLACMLFIKITSHWNTAERIARKVEWSTVVSSVPWSPLFFPEEGNEWAPRTNPAHRAHLFLAGLLFDLRRVQHSRSWAELGCVELAASRTFTFT